MNNNVFYSNETYRIRVLNADFATIHQTIEFRQDGRNRVPFIVVGTDSAVRKDSTANRTDFSLGPA